MLTNAAIKAARPRARAYKMFDERGLHLFVAPTGLKAWRMRYRFAGREKLLSIGRWPEVSLAQARETAEGARDQLAGGRDPSTGHHAAGQADSFESVARDWFAARRARWSEVHAGDVIASLEHHAFPLIGGRPVDLIKATDILELIQAIEARGAIETARRVRQRIDNVFAFALVREQCDLNPAALVAAELAPATSVRRHPALIEIEPLRALLAAADALDAAPLIKLASRFLALTATRIGPLRLARWCEIEDLDGTCPIWRIPAAHMKLSKARKADPANEHLVPLADQAARILRSLRHGPGDRGAQPIFPIGAGAISDLYARAGYAGRHVPHGWRASFSTIMNERHPLDRELIDQALAHVPTNKVEAAYNRAEHLDRRRDLFRRWAELLAG